MAIGLDAEQLILAFARSYAERKTNLTSGMILGKAGVAPDYEELRLGLQQIFPGFSSDDINRVLNILYAVVDMIIANNRKLAEDFKGG